MYILRGDNLKKYLKILTILLSFIILLSGCNNKNNKEEELNNKINIEVSYIDSELVYIVNALNDINYARYKVVTQEVESSAGTNKRWGK